jgi:nickel-dependent lactate racemase
MTALRYGANASIQLDFADGVTPVELGTPSAGTVGDLREAVRRTLDEPLEYPPLARCTTPGDRVVLALGHGLPQAAEVVAAVVDALQDARVDADGISVVRTRADVDDGTEDPCRLLSAAARERIVVAIHDPTDRNTLAYLAASENGEPILLHRALHDADLVLPIGCLHGEPTGGYFGIHDTVFPTFSDEKTRTRFRSLPSSHTGGKRHRQLVAEVDHVAWLLGVSFTIQLVPGPGSRVMDVVAGESESVRRHGRELYRQAWGASAPQPASLVVAAIEGDDAQQTWENFGRALEAATNLVEDGGAIAVCCDLAAAPGSAMQRIAGAASREEALRQIRRDCPEDTLPAAQLDRALDRGRVYLLSRLETSVVEDLEMICVENPAELCRLVRQHRSCTVLANAPYVTTTPGSEPVGGDSVGDR